MKFAICFLIFISIISLLLNPRHSFSQNITKGTEQSYSFNTDTALINTNFQQAVKLNDKAQYDSSNFYFNIAIDIIKRLILEHNDPKLWEKYVKCYNGIGENYRTKGEYDLASESIQVALKAGKEHFGENNSCVAESYRNIGAIYHRKREYEKAFEYHQKALNIRAEIFGENHRDVADSYTNIGYVHYSKGDYDKAFEYHQKALNIRTEIFGENHRDVATSYNNIGAVYYVKGNYDQALEFDQKALNIRLSTLEENHLDIARSYNDIGAVYSRKGDYEKALEYYKKALNIRLSKLGEDHSSVASSYNNVGGIYKSKSEYDKALEFFQKALNINIKTLGENHPAVGISYNNIGTVYDDKGEYEKGIEYYHKSLNIWRKTFGESHINVAISYNNIGALYEKKGDYNRALEYHQMSLNIRLKTFGENHPGVANSYNNIGAIYDQKGNYEQALEFYHRALNIQRKTLGDNHPAVATSYNNIGVVYERKGDHEKSLDYHKKGLEIELKTLGENHPRVANSYDNIGGIYTRKGDYERALEHHQMALNIKLKTLGEDHPAVAYSFNNIGFAYAGKGDYEKALEYYEPALDLRIKTLGDNHPAVASSYINIGFVYRNINEYDKALEYQQKALDTHIITYGETNPEVAKAYNHIGVTHFKKGDYEKSLLFYQKACIANIEDFNNEDIYINPNLRNILSKRIFLNSLTNKASTFFKIYNSKSKNIKDLTTASATYQLAVALIDTMRGGFQAEGSKLFLAELASKFYDQAIRTALTLYDITNEADYKEQTFVVAEKSKSAVLWEALSNAKAKQFGGIPGQLLEKEQTLRIDLAFYDTQIQKLKQKKNQQDTELIKEFEGRQFDLKREYESLIAQFENEYPKYYDLKYRTETASVTDIQRALDNQTCLVEYFIGDSSLYIFTISKENYDVYSVAIDSTFIPLLNGYYNSISKYERRSFAESSHKLYQMFIKPIEDNITGKEKLLIIPDGMLYSIPFEALISQEAQTDNFTKLDYLITQYDISYHYSANLWLRGVETVSSPTSTGFIAFAPVFSEQLQNGYIATRSIDELEVAEIDINYLRSGSITEEENRKKFVPLPASEEEVRAIANLFKQKNSTAHLYLHQEAKEEHLKTKAKDYKYVHIATHGWMDEERPILSGVAFSQPTDTVFKEDGILYAGEMYNLELNSDLVILSACESGIGKLVKGEGPLSLTRGLLYSGANNIIISLWAVSDIYTGKLMVDLYDNILSGRSYAKALRAAKLKMIEDEKSSFPAKWSGFVLVGR
jgi:tetratricopeptide (TPR) repeat protein